MKKLILFFGLIASLFFTPVIKADFSKEELAELESLTTELLGNLSPEEQEAVMQQAMELDKQIQQMSPEEQKALQEELEFGIKDMFESGAIDDIQNQLKSKEDTSESKENEKEEKQPEVKEDLDLKEKIKEIVEIISDFTVVIEKDPKLQADWSNSEEKVQELKRSLLIVSNDPKLMTELSKSEFSILKSQIENFYTEIKNNAKNLEKIKVETSKLENILNLLDQKSKELDIGLKKLFEKFPKEDIEKIKKEIELQQKELEKQKAATQQTESKTASGSNVSKVVKQRWPNQKFDVKPNNNGSVSPGFVANKFDNIIDKPTKKEDKEKEPQPKPQPGPTNTGGKPEIKKDKDPKSGDNTGLPKGKNQQADDKPIRRPVFSNWDAILSEKRSDFAKQVSAISKSIGKTTLLDDLKSLTEKLGKATDKEIEDLSSQISKALSEVKKPFETLENKAKNMGEILKYVDSKKAKEEAEKTFKSLKDKKKIKSLKESLEKLNKLDLKKTKASKLQEQIEKLLRQHKSTKKSLGLKK